MKLQKRQNGEDTDPDENTKRKRVKRAGRRLEKRSKAVRADKEAPRRGQGLDQERLVEDDIEVGDEDSIGGLSEE